MTRQCTCKSTTGSITSKRLTGRLPFFLLRWARSGRAQLGVLGGPFTSASFNSVSSLNPVAHEQMSTNNNNNGDNL